jgi:hypothetical protein
VVNSYSFFYIFAKIILIQKKHKSLIKHLLKIILVFLFTSCIVQGLNVNYYKLSESEKLHFVPFNSANLFKTVNYDEQNLKVEEITSNNVKDVIQNHKFVCIYSWVPYCKNTSCENLNYYSNLEEKFKKWNLNFLIISETYDLEDIKLSHRTSEYNKQLYVIKYDKANYGDQRKNVVTKFYNDIALTKRWSTYYFFYDAKLIFYSYNCTESLVDSLIQTFNKN